MSRPRRAAAFGLDVLLWVAVIGAVLFLLFGVLLPVFG